MKRKTLLNISLAVAFLGLAIAAPAARSQDWGGQGGAYQGTGDQNGGVQTLGVQDWGTEISNRVVSWFTGDPAVLESPSDIPAGPQYYAEDTCCPDGSCGNCSQCCQTHHTWGSIEFLMWWGKGTYLPPLVTTSTPGTISSQAGILGVNSTSILFGNELGANKLRGGGRIAAGVWLDPQHNVAVGGRFWGLGGDTTRFSQSSDGTTILGLPFFNALLNQEDAFLVAYPGFSRGSVRAHVTTNNIISAEAFTEIMMCRDCRKRVDLVGGYQFFRLDDAFEINSESTITEAGNPFVGINTALNDRFVTRNQFHGGELGLRGRMAHGCWSLNVLGQVAIGNMNEQVVISGTTVISSVSGSQTTPGGLLTQPSNIGSYERNRFAAIPQFTGNLCYHCSPCLSFHMGYNLVWITHVALSSEQIDRTVNLAQPFGPNRPTFTFQDREYWLQGINCGMNWDF